MIYLMLNNPKAGKMSRNKFIALTVLILIVSALLLQGIEPAKRMLFVLAAIGVYCVFVGAACSNKNNGV